MAQTHKLILIARGATRIEFHQRKTPTSSYYVPLLVIPGSLIPASGQVFVHSFARINSRDTDSPAVIRAKITWGNHQGGGQDTLHYHLYGNRTVEQHPLSTPEPVEEVSNLGTLETIAAIMNTGLSGHIPEASGAAAGSGPGPAVAAVPFVAAPGPAGHLVSASWPPPDAPVALGTRGRVIAAVYARIYGGHHGVSKTAAYIEQRLPATLPTEHSVRRAVGRILSNLPVDKPSFLERQRISGQVAHQFKVQGLLSPVRLGTRGRVIAAVYTRLYGWHHDNPKTAAYIEQRLPAALPTKHSVRRAVGRILANLPVDKPSFWERQRISGQVAHQFKVQGLLSQHPTLPHIATVEQSALQGLVTEEGRVTEEVDWNAVSGFLMDDAPDPLQGKMPPVSATTVDSSSSAPKNGTNGGGVPIEEPQTGTNGGGVPIEEPQTAELFVAAEDTDLVVDLAPVVKPPWYTDWKLVVPAAAAVGGGVYWYKKNR